MFSMGKITGDSPCELCQAEGRDSNGTHKITFEDGGQYCKVHGYLGGTDGSTTVTHTRELDTMTEFNEVKDLPIKALTDRGIAQDVCEHYGVHTSYDTGTGKADAYFYPMYVDGKLEAYSKRTLPKTFTIIGNSLKGRKVEFIGQQACKGGRKLLVVEGKDDALAGYQMLSKYKQDVVALPYGDKIGVFADQEKFIARYDEVVYCKDDDKAGDAVEVKLSQLYPDMKFMTISEKDGNDMLRKGKGKEFINAFFKAAPLAPEGFVTVDDVFDEATAMPTAGRPWPWPSLNKLTYGRRDGEGAYFGSGVKMGKSEAVNQIAHHDTQVLGDKIALFKLEEKPSMTVRKIAGKIAHKQFHIPDGDFTQAELIEGVRAVGDKVILYDSYGSTAWDDLKVAIRHAVVVEGVKTVIIDPLTRLTTGMDAASANTELERVADEISKMAKDLGFFYIFFCHLKAPQHGKSHESGGKVRSNQFTGSRAMMRACYFMIGIERDKTCDDEMERNTSSFVLLEDRAFGNFGSFDVFYDRATGDYLEPTREFV